MAKKTRHRGAPRSETNKDDSFSDTNSMYSETSSVMSEGPQPFITATKQELVRRSRRTDRPYSSKRPSEQLLMTAEEIEPKRERHKSYSPEPHKKELTYRRFCFNIHRPVCEAAASVEVLQPSCELKVNA